MENKNIKAYYAPRGFGKTYYQNKQMQKQIIELKKYIVQLENKLEVKELEKKF